MGHNFNYFNNMKDGKILYIKYKLNISSIALIKPEKEERFFFYTCLILLFILISQIHALLFSGSVIMSTLYFSFKINK